MMDRSEQQLANEEAGRSSPPGGILLPCPCCGEPNARVSLDLDDLRTCTCRECETEFTLDDIRAFLHRWSKVLKGVEAMRGLLAE